MVVSDLYQNLPVLTQISPINRVPLIAEFQKHLFVAWIDFSFWIRVQPHRFRQRRKISRQCWWRIWKRAVSFSNWILIKWVTHTRINIRNKKKTANPFKDLAAFKFVEPRGVEPLSYAIFQSSNYTFI